MHTPYLYPYVKRDLHDNEISHLPGSGGPRTQELPIRYAQRILQIETLPGWQASQELVEALGNPKKLPLKGET